MKRPGPAIIGTRPRENQSPIGVHTMQQDDPPTWRDIHSPAPHRATNGTPRDDERRQGMSGTSPELARPSSEELPSLGPPAMGAAGVDRPGVRKDLASRSLLRALHDLTPELTAAELRICLLSERMLSNKEIAEALDISVRTVETHRTRIRRKLRLPPHQNLNTYLLGLDRD